MKSDATSEEISRAEEKLKAREMKLTSRREHILRVLLENKDKHLSAEEVYQLVKQRAPDVGLATVYRTLELFLAVDIVHSIDFGDGRRRYELNSGNSDEMHRHHHLICLRCGRIIEMEEDLLEELEARVVRNWNFRVVNHELKIYGFCQDCS